MSVVHSHSACITLFSVLRDVKLRPLCHMCGFLGAGAPVFEIRDVAGDGTDLLIRSNDLGKSLVSSLGEGSVVLMRGHGATTTGPSLKHAVYRAIYAEVNANLQRDALRVGEATYLSLAEALTAQQNVETQIERPWGLWKARVMP
jgi:HCOMODA/2-hydroxy-3-carboxy-muconic semialdehyde decarboxylase